MQFWREQLRSVGCLNQTLTELKNHPLPLARIKKIMKSDEDVRMISSEAPVLFAKACELFILELTHRAWACSETNKRRTLQHTDIVYAILNHEHEVFEFLVRLCCSLFACSSLHLDGPVLLLADKVATRAIGCTLLVLPPWY